MTYWSDRKTQKNTPYLLFIYTRHSICSYPMATTSRFGLIKIPFFILSAIYMTSKPWDKRKTKFHNINRAIAEKRLVTNKHVVFISCIRISVLQKKFILEAKMWFGFLVILCSFYVLQFRYYNYSRNLPLVV